MSKRIPRKKIFQILGIIGIILVVGLGIWIFRKSFFPSAAGTFVLSPNAVQKANQGTVYQFNNSNGIQNAYDQNSFIPKGIYQTDFGQNGAYYKYGEIQEMLATRCCKTKDGQGNCIEYNCESRDTLDDVKAAGYNWAEIAGFYQGEQSEFDRASQVGVKVVSYLARLRYQPPKAQYAFNEGTGTTINDISGNNNNGVISGAPVTWPTGKIGKSLQFDGTNDYVQVNDSDSISPRVVTIMGWFNFDKLGGTYGLIWKNSYNYMLYTEAGLVKFRAHAADGSTLEASFPENLIKTGQWYYIAGVYDGRTANIYLNGELKNYSQTLASTQILKDNAGNLIMGKRGDQNKFFKGKIDDVKIYGTAVNQEGITYFYSNPGQSYSDSLKSVIQTRKNQTSLFGWFLAEEPFHFYRSEAKSGIFPDLSAAYNYFQNTYNLIKGIDTNHPVFIEENGNALEEWSGFTNETKDNVALNQWVNIGDFFMSSSYGIVADSTSIERGLHAIDISKAKLQNKPYVTLAQACSTPYSKVVANKWVMPSPAQARAEIYGAIIHGAVGYMVYTMNTPWMFGNRTHEGIYPVVDSPNAIHTDVWDQIAIVNKEIEDIKPIILTPTSTIDYNVYVDNTPNLQYYSNSPVHTILKEYQGKLYLITVNITNQIVYARFDFPFPIKNLKEIKSSNDFISGNSIHTRYPSYQTRIFSFERM